MNANENARRLLFRAVTGAEPLPTTEEIAEARARLAEDRTAHAALDELLAVITRTDRAPQAGWYDLLHAYAVAQLAGRGESAEFTPVRRLLDGDVALAEEYALLYETLRTEAAGHLPHPMEVPPLDLSFLPPPVRTGWLARLLPRRTPPLASLAQFFQQMGRLQQVAASAAVALALFIGAWATDLAWQRSTTADNSPNQPTSTAVSKNDPLPLEEPLSGWSGGADTHPLRVDNPLTTACAEAVVGNAARKECPM